MLTLASRKLRAAATNLDVVMLVASQLNRNIEKRQQDSKEDIEPMMSDLRGSGSLEQDADIIGFLYEPLKLRYTLSPDKKVRRLHIVKNREGETGKIDYQFIQQVMMFAELNPGG